MRTTSFCLGGFSRTKKAWFLSHVNDHYVKRANQENYRSRAAFKLISILEKYKFAPNKIVDLGCSPGSWSQVAKVHYPSAQIIGIDLLETKPIAGVNIVQGDARSPKFHELVRQEFGQLDLLISDMAPDFGGDGATTHSQILELNLLCMGLCAELGSQGCNLVMKTTYGENQKNLYDINRYLFTKISRQKPASSRSQSVELYYVCEGLKDRFRGPGMLDKIGALAVGQMKTKGDIERALA